MKEKHFHPSYETGPYMKGQGAPLDPSGNVVPWNSPDAHWPIKLGIGLGIGFGIEESLGQEENVGPKIIEQEKK